MPTSGIPDSNDSIMSRDGQVAAIWAVGHAATEGPADENCLWFQGVQRLVRVPGLTCRASPSLLPILLTCWTDEVFDEAPEIFGASLRLKSPPGSAANPPIPTRQVQFVATHASALSSYPKTT